MERFISHKTCCKSVAIPPSKSFAQRAILAASLCEYPVELKHLGGSADVRHFLNMSKQLGAHHEQLDRDLTRIQGFQNQRSPQLNAGESGLGMRLITSICAVLGPSFEIIGKGSLLKRPIHDFEQLLPQIGVACKTKNGYLPLVVQGKAKGGRIQLDGSSGSQYLTGLLMALPLAEEDSEIYVKDLTSKPYIDITIQVLGAFGIEINHTNYEQFQIAGRQVYQRMSPYIVEGDYSGASNWMVYGAINQGIVIKGLNSESVQGDRAMLKALSCAGIKTLWKNNNLIIEKGRIQPFNFDATEFPDLFPALVVLAAAANGTSRLKGANRLIHKESNRAKVLVREFSKLNLSILQDGDYLIIEGDGQLQSGTIHSNNDHRIAMAAGIAASLTNYGIIILEAESVEKSYPNFWLTFHVE